MHNKEPNTSSTSSLPSTALYNDLRMAPTSKTTDDIAKNMKKLSLCATSSKLEELPTEVVESMAAQMGLETIRSFRSTGKHAAQCADFHFKRNYNHTISTDFSLEDYGGLERRLAEEPRRGGYGVFETWSNFPWEPASAGAGWKVVPWI
ncbi:hypothetical protein BJX62DRAFT_236561 [Aspergillus germanicus]